MLIDIASDHEEIGKQLSCLDDLVAGLLEQVLRQIRRQPIDQREMAAAWRRQDTDEIIDAARDSRDLAGIGEPRIALAVPDSCDKRLGKMALEAVADYERGFGIVDRAGDEQHGVGAHLPVPCELCAELLK